ncbi:MAG: hypothetical protein AAGC53_19810 [Actinomycetota bacterium]
MKPNPSNVVVLHGALSSEPRRQTLPSGDLLVSYEVTTPGTNGRVGVPVVSFSPTRPPAVGKGDPVVVVGSVRRRFFRAEGRSTSRTEVVAEVVARPGSRTAERLLKAAADAVAGDSA